MRKNRLRSLVLLLLLPCTQIFATEFPQASTRRLDVRAPAQIIRDEHGVPHIFATTERDLLFLQGYVQARDRLFQMDMLRRQADGTLAELLGSSALPSDIQLRTFGIRRAAEASVPALSPETRAGFKAYAQGVNAYAMSHPLPPEYQRSKSRTFAHGPTSIQCPFSS